MYLFFVLSSIKITLSHLYLELLFVDSFVKQCSFKLVALNHSITFFFVLIMRFRTSCLRDRSLITSRDKISQFLKCFHVLMLIYTCFYKMLLFTKIDFCFNYHFFLKMIIKLFSSSFVSLLISKYLFFLFNKLLDIIIREVVLTCDEIWEFFCKKVFWKQDARTESFVIDVLTEKSLTKNARIKSFVIDVLTEESLTKNARIKSFVIDVLTEESLTNESFRDWSFVNNAFLNSNSLTKWLLNLFNVDSIILDVWYSSI